MLTVAYYVAHEMIMIKYVYSDEDYQSNVESINNLNKSARKTKDQITFGTLKPEKKRGLEKQVENFKNRTRQYYWENSQVSGNNVTD